MCACARARAAAAQHVGKWLSRILFLALYLTVPRNRNTFICTRRMLEDTVCCSVECPENASSKIFLSPFGQMRVHYPEHAAVLPSAGTSFPSRSPAVCGTRIISTVFVKACHCFLYSASRFHQRSRAVSRSSFFNIFLPAMFAYFQVIFCLRAF